MLIRRRNILRSMGYSGLVLFFVFMGLSCAGTMHKETTTETVVTSPGQQAGNGGYVYQSNSQVSEKIETVTTTKTTESGHPGLISSTVHAIGWVLALPFRLVGGLLSWIY